jgi:hypothetical protein
MNSPVFTIADLCGTYLRPAVTQGDAAGVGWVFVPPLTTQEQAIFADVVSLANSAAGLTPTDYAAVRTQMQALRAVRQTTRNAYVNMTEADRNRMDYDALVACCEIFIKLLRDAP